MSGNTTQTDEAQTTKYTVESSAASSQQEAQVVDVADEPETPREADSEEPAPEKNENADYGVNMPPAFTMVVNAKAWHPSWGAAPAGYELIVPRTQSVVTADTEMTLGETSDGQPIKQGVRAIKKGNYTNTPDGLGAEVGSGWTYHIPDWQLMERELAGDGVDLSGSGVARLEAATAEKEEERRRSQELPSRDDVYEHYEPEPVINEESDVMTLWDAADEETTEKIEGILGETGDEQPEPMSMMEAWEEVRQYTLDCASRRAVECREAVAEADITNTAQRAFDTFNHNGNQTLESRQATFRAADHRRFDTDFMRSRPVNGFHPKWGADEPETEEVEIGGQTVEVATDPIAPISSKTVQWAAEQAQQFLLSRSLLDSIESGVIRLLDRNEIRTGTSAETETGVG